MLRIRARNKVEFGIWSFYYKGNGPRKPANWKRTVRNSTQQEKIFKYFHIFFVVVVTFLTMI